MFFHSPSSSVSVKAKRAVFENPSTSSTGPRSCHAMAPSASSPRTKRARQPLAFLSPNNIAHAWTSAKKSFSPTKTPRQASLRSNHEGTENLKAEVENLRSQIATMDANTGSGGVEETSTSTDESGRVQRSKLEELNRKLKSIQHGLSEIEKERESLVSTAHRLESEKSALESELGRRELEIASLARRCSTQADKMKEATLLKSENRELRREVEDLKLELTRKEKDSANSQRLGMDLEETARDRGELLKRLECIKKDHDLVTEKLRLCLSNVEKLTREKREWEEERRRLLQRLELDLEQQRLDHVQHTIELQESMRTQGDKISEHERIIKEKSRRIVTLQNELAETESRHKEKISELYKTYEQQLAARHQVSLSSTNYILEAQCEQFKAKLEEKESVIAALEVDLASFMHEHMAAVTALQELQADTRSPHSMASAIEPLERECWALSDTLHERETEIAVLSAEILKLEIEKELLAQDSEKIDRLNRKLVALEAAKTSIQRQLESDLDDARMTISELKASEVDFKASFEQTLAGQKEVHDQTIMNLREEIAHYKEALSKTMDLLAHDREPVIEELRAELEMKKRDCASLESVVLFVQNQSNADELRLKKELTTKDNVIMSLKSEIRQLQESIVEGNRLQQDEITTIREELRTTTMNLAIRDDEIRDLRLFELAERDETIALMRQEIFNLKVEMTIKESENVSDTQLLHGKDRQVTERKVEKDKIQRERASGIPPPSKTVRRKLPRNVQSASASQGTRSVADDLTPLLPETEDLDRTLDSLLADW